MFERMPRDLYQSPTNERLYDDTHEEAVRRERLAQYRAREAERRESEANDEQRP